MLFKENKIEVIYEKNKGTVQDLVFFRNIEELEEWLPKQLKFNPDTQIKSIKSINKEV